MTTALESTNNPQGSDASRRLNYIYRAWRAAGVDADLARKACEQLLNLADRNITPASTNYIYRAWRAAGVDADLAHKACEQLLRYYRPRSRASSACI